MKIFENFCSRKINNADNLTFLYSTVHPTDILFDIFTANFIYCGNNGYCKS